MSVTIYNINFDPVGAVVDVSAVDMSMVLDDIAAADVVCDIDIITTTGEALPWYPSANIVNSVPAIRYIPRNAGPDAATGMRIRLLPDPSKVDAIIQTVLIKTAVLVVSTAPLCTQSNEFDTGGFEITNHRDSTIGAGAYADRISGDLGGKVSTPADNNPG